MSRGMLRHVARFEWRYQVRSPVFVIGCALFFLITFGATTNSHIQIGSRGNVYVNAPVAIIQTLQIMMLFAIFIVVAMIANVVLRDDETGFAPILRSTSLSKFDYLVGRFAGACAAALCVLAVMPLGVLIGSLMPWLDPEKVGALHVTHYLYALFVFALPTLLIIAAGYFALAVATRSMMWTYVGVLATLVLYGAAAGLLRDPAFDSVSALADPFGLSALSLATKYWTATERNTQLPPVEGLLLANRLLWSGIALVVFAIGYLRFKLEQRSPKLRDERPRWWRRRAQRPVVGAPGLSPIASVSTAPLAMPRADRATRLAQLWRLARFDMRFVFRSPAFFVLLGIGMLNAADSLWHIQTWYGANSYPATHLLVQNLFGAFTIIPIIIAVFYSGELVWRDRDRKLHEIIDATAAPDWAHLVPKIVAITLVLFATTVVAALTAVVVQLVHGYHDFELMHYVTWYVLPSTILALQLAMLSVFVQVLVPQKYIGWGVLLVFLVANTALTSAGFEHNLYNYGDTSPVPLSAMNGSGRFWIGRAWFNVYWTAFGLILTVLAFALWRRGTTTALRPRLRLLGSRLRGGALAVLVLSTLVWLGSGAFIYDNTNILNRYFTADDGDQWRADFERAFLQYVNVPVPQLTSVTLDVALYPHDVKAVTTGSYQLQNRSDAPIAALHLSWPRNLELDHIELAGASVAQDWPELHYRIYKLAPALQPGETRTLKFATTLEERGFPNGAPLTRIVDNGTFLDNTEISPMIRFSREILLRDRATRRKYGLPPELSLPTLDDPHGREVSALPASGWVSGDITITTDADQTPLAPGYTVSDTTSRGRRTVRFRTDAPINYFFSIQSARYAVLHDRWHDVDLAVYYHPEHAYNVARMMNAMKVSLEMFSTRFSPYQFRQARILEFPGYANFAESFANTIPYSETIGFLTQLGDPDDIDINTYVTAHEIAHQWWGHQLVPSFQQGAPLLSESLAQYSALLVMEHMYGREQIRKFLKYELDRYLRNRGAETVEEQPLATVELQGYIYYQKGSLAMYWLKEVVGEDVVDRALAQLLRDHAFKPAPYPNSRDFIAALRASAGPKYDALITDLFEKITLLDVKATHATATLRSDGKYDVALEVEAHKLYADGKGVQTEAPLDEPIDIGVFTSAPGSHAFTASSVLAMQQHPVHTGKQTIAVVVDQLPSYAGIDPYNKRIDRNSDDNTTKVDLLPGSR